MLTALTVAVIVAQLAAGAALLRISVRHYASLAALMAVLSVEAAGALLFSPHSSAYLWFWMALQPAKYALVALVAFQMIRRLPEHYGPRLGRFGRDILLQSLQLALLISLASGLIEALYARSEYGAPWLPFAFAFGRVFMVLAAVVLALIAWWVYRSGVRLSRNLPRHAGLFAAYLWTHMIVYLTRNLLGNRASYQLDELMLLADILLSVSWIALLAPAGEALPPKIEHTPDQLAALDARADALTRALKKAGE